VVTESEAYPQETRGSKTNPQVTLAINEIKSCLEALQWKEQTLEDLRARLRKMTGKGEAEGPSRPSKPRTLPDLRKSSLEQLHDMTASLEIELEELHRQETTIRQQIFENSVYFKNNNRGTNNGRGNQAPPSASIGALAGVEQEWIDDPACLLNEDYDWGLCWDRKWQDQPMGPIDENMRRNRREGTKRKVAEVLGLYNFGEPYRQPKKAQGHALHVFLDRTPASTVGNAPAGGTYLLGRYDVVAVCVCADLDRNWNFIKGQKRDFWVAHAAALNIGESVHATDFLDFCQQENSLTDNNPGGLDEDPYLDATEHILANVCQACTSLGIEHLVFFPFGMGAFLRHLGQLDTRYTSDEEMQRLRRRLARSFIKVLAAATNEATSIHLCLMFADEETQCNADAFIRALHDSPSKLRKRVTIYPEGDCLHLAHELAQKSDKVMLVNGANRALIGNHWFAGRAKLAIDENLHRRSWRMSAIAYLLNSFDGREPVDRHPDQLLHTAQWLGGQIHMIDRIGNV